MLFSHAMQKEKTDGLKAYLNTPKNIVVTNHVNPDGDAMGSALAMMFLLQKMGHSVNVIVPNDYPRFLKWLPGSDEVIIFDYKEKKSKELIAAADLVIVLDYNALHRSSGLEKVFKKYAGKFLMIDHHQQPEDFADWMISDVSKCSTAQMVFDFAAFLGKTELLDLDIATNLYTGIVTDTGSFRFSSTTADVHRIVAQLLDLGVKPNVVYNQVFDSNGVSRLKLLGSMLENMEVYQDKKAVVLFLSEENQIAYNYKKGDSEGFVNYGLSISGIEFSIFFREEKGDVKISLRSKGDLDVNVLARKYFNGGGHKNAAGGLLNISLSEAKEFAKKVILEL